IAEVKARLSLSFEADPTAGTLVCTATGGSADLTLLEEHAYQAVLLMTWITFDAPLPWTAKSLFDWFTRAVQAVRFRGDIQYSFCCEPANTIDIQTNNMAATMPDISETTPSIGTVWLMVLYAHEARHNEIGGHTCGTNDQTIAELGAWGVQYYLNYWM